MFNGALCEVHAYTLTISDSHLCISPYWRSGISSTSVRNSVFSRVERSERVERRWISLTSGRNPRSSIRTSAIPVSSVSTFKKNKACRFYSFIRMSMSCLLHTILKCLVQCSKYTLMYQKSYILVSDCIAKNLFSESNLTAQIEPVQDNLGSTKLF